MTAYPDDPIIVAPDATASEVMLLMQIHKSACVLVCEGGKLVGIFTDRDALRWMALQSAANAKSRSDQPIGELMTARPASLSSTTCVGEAIRKMSAGRYRHLPIVDGNQLAIGVASVNGIVRYLVEHFPQTIYTLPPQPGKVPSEREGA